MFYLKTYIWACAYEGLLELVIRLMTDRLDVKVYMYIMHVRKYSVKIDFTVYIFIAYCRCVFEMI